MPDLEMILSQSADRSSVAAPGLSTRIRCPNCTADLTFLPTGARYCHHCGSLLKSESRSGFADPRGALAPTGRSRRRRAFRRPQWLSNLWCACTATDGDDWAFAGRSEVLLAFGKSMFNLGWRYEHAIGARRNLDEAARCYWKAARLGDPSAVGRLGREEIDRAADPATPPRLPPSPTAADVPPVVESPPLLP